MKKKKDNVIFFPKLKERLSWIALDALKGKKYKEALEHFEQYCHLYPESEEDAEIQIGIVVCLLELGSYLEAKERCRRLLLADIGDYFNVLQIYITILIQLNEFTEVVATLETVMHESKLPPNKAEHFYQLLDFARKMESQPKVSKEETGVSRVDYRPIFEKIVQTDEMSQQLQLVNDVLKGMIEETFPFLKKLLVEKEVHPFIKTVILQHLIELGIEAKVKVQKQDNIKTMNISQLEDVLEQQWVLKVTKILENELANENPTLFDAVKQIWEHFCFIQYPFLPLIRKEAIWAAALHKIGYEIHGIEIEDNEICSRYNVEINKVNEAVTKIYEAERM